MEVLLPFSGFKYNSIHNEEIDSAIRDLSDYNERLQNRLNADIKFIQVFNTYAISFTRLFAQVNGLSTLTFQDYHLKTDRIFCQISEIEAINLFNQVDKDELNQLIKENFTSYDGFLSFYPNSLEKWSKDVTDWDHNQLGTLLECFYKSNNENSDKLVSSLQDHAIAHNAVYNGIPERLLKVINYLDTRKNRSK